jgi:hypothetical protein
MKKFGILLIAAFCIVSCKNVEQFKAGIEELGTKWDGATSAFGDFSKLVETENTTFASLTDSVVIDSVKFSKLNAASQAQITDAKNTFTNAGAGYANLLTEIGTFTTNWTAKAAELTSLKDGLASGKLDGDVLGKITELTNFATEGESKLNTLKDTFKSTKEGVTNSYVNYKNTVANLIK